MEKRTNTLHIINSIETILLIIISVVSLFFVAQGVSTAGNENANTLVLVLRVSLSVIILIFALVFLFFGMVLPAKSLALSEDQQRKVKKVSGFFLVLTGFLYLYELIQGKLFTSGSGSHYFTPVTLLLEASGIKSVRRIWPWVAVLVIFLMTLGLFWLLLAMSAESGFSGFANVYNVLCTINLGLLALLTITSIMWRVSTKKLYPDVKAANAKELRFEERRHEL